MSKELIIKNHRLSRDKVSVCLPVVASTKDSILSKVKNCVDTGVPIVELRADFFDFIEDDSQVSELLEKVAELTANTIVLFTVRTNVEGGEYSHSQESYERILLNAAKSKSVDVVDVEVSHLDDASHLVELIHEAGKIVLASHHDFEKTPELLDMLDIYDDMVETGADILKLAVMPNNADDVLKSMKAALIANEECEDGLVVMISMGQLGKISRVAGLLVGSCITFGALEDSSAPGQIELSDLNHILKILE